MSHMYMYVQACTYSCAASSWHLSRPSPSQSTCKGAAAVAGLVCCWVCARRRADRQRHAALGGKVPAELPAPPDTALGGKVPAEVHDVEQPDTRLHDSQTLSHPAIEMKLPGQHCHVICYLLRMPRRIDTLNVEAVRPMRVDPTHVIAMSCSEWTSSAQPLQAVPASNHS